MFILTTSNQHYVVGPSQEKKEKVPTEVRETDRIYGANLECSWPGPNNTIYGFQSTTRYSLPPPTLINPK